MLEFRETPMFTRAIVELLDDKEYAELQGTLVITPQAGDLIQGTGGLRKLRWRQATRGKGKRSGIRVIYYWHEAGTLIYMLLAYSKGERDDLAQSEKRLLRRLVTEEFK
jgi:hypothetical protein